MKTAQKFFIILAGSMFWGMGCSSTPPAPKVWYKPGASSEETVRDFNLCKTLAAQVASSQPMLQGNTVGQTVAMNLAAGNLGSNREEKYLRMGMTSMGYTLVDEQALQSGKPIANDFTKTAKDNVKFVASLTSKAERGDPMSQYFLANCYYYGSCGLATNLETARQWYFLATYQNSTHQYQAAQNNYLSAPNSPQPLGFDQIRPNAYGLGVNSDQYGRPRTYQTEDGQPLPPILNEGVKQNAYGPGVGMDQFGRPVYNSPPP